MIGARLIHLSLAILVLAAGAAKVGAIGIFSKKPKSEAHVKRAIETVRNETDEKKRRAALADLQDADPRTHAEVIPTLIIVLQKDASAQLRALAAEIIGQYRIVYPVAGMALEAAAELDGSRTVRESAQQALWEYHLSGYRSLRGVDGIAGQTAEPPISRPSPMQTTVSPVVKVSVEIPQTMAAAPRRMAELPPIAPLPSMNVRSATSSAAAVRQFRSPLAILRSLSPAKLIPAKAPAFGAPVHLSLTPEPPIALPRVLEIAPAPTPVVARAAAPEYDLPPIAVPRSVEMPVSSPMPISIPGTIPLRLPADPITPGPRIRTPLWK
ncbi:MAG TPA: hypothetical protein VGL71_13775 [Urbifossiella sp.]